MQRPTNLRIAERARTLAALVYRATAEFPPREQYGLTAQMRRAAVSIGSNVYEGCGRSGGRELIHFLQIALGSASELEFQTIVAADLGLFSPDIQSEVTEEVNHTKRMLLRLISAVQAHSFAKSQRPRAGAGGK